MKRIYISPEIDFVECVPGIVLQGSLEVDNSGPFNEDDLDGEATGAARGDWSGIWDGM